MSDMKKRTGSAIILLVILVVSLIISSKLFGIVLSIVSLIGYNEAFNIKYEKNKINIIKYIGMILLLLIVLNNTFYVINNDVLIILVLLFLSMPIVFYNNSSLFNIEDSLYIIGIVLLLGYAFQNIIYLRDTSISKCIYIFIISFITDTYAYIGGSLIGRHTFTSISPKKTIEGCSVGLVMGTIIGSVYYNLMVVGTSIGDSIIYSLILTILSMIGDLFFSCIKRYYGKKDYSNLIPGHGGILDRFDSVIYVSLGLLLLLKLF